MDTDITRLLNQLEPAAPPFPSAPLGRAPRQVRGTPHRPGSVAPVSLASTNDDLLPTVTRRRFLRRR